METVVQASMQVIWAYCQDRVLHVPATTTTATLGRRRTLIHHVHVNLLLLLLVGRTVIPCTTVGGHVMLLLGWNVLLRCVPFSIK